MSIRGKVALAIVVVLLLGGLAVHYTTGILFQDAIEQATDHAVVTASESYAALETQDIEKLSAVNDVLRTRADLRELFIAGDRDGLYEASLPIFEELKEEYGVTHMYFEHAEPSSTVFLRVHDKDKFGDEIVRDSYLEAVDSKSSSAGKDLGKTAFALRVVYPWYDENKILLGYVETGQEIEEFLGVAAEQSGNELALVLRKDALDGEEWAVMRENRGLENTWDDHDEFVVADSTMTRVDTAVLDEISLTDLADEGDAIRTDIVEGTEHVVGAFPVTNTVGERVGFVVVQRDITDEVEQLNQARLQMTVILLLIGTILILIVLFLLNSLVFKRLAVMTEHMEQASTRLAGGDFDIKVPKVRGNDEIGSFERFFAQFLRAVSESLQQLTKE